MNVVLFDDCWREQLLPLTYIRPVSELRIGILTIREKWQKHLNVDSISWKTTSYLSEKYPLQTSHDNLYLNGHCCPDQVLAEKVKNLSIGQGLKFENIVIAQRLSATDDFLNPAIDWINLSGKPTLLTHLWELFLFNGKELTNDFNLLTKDRDSAPIPPTVNVLGKELVFIEQGARLNFATINAQNGPVYIGKNAEIMEGALIRGPFALCDHSTVHMGAKIYGPTTIGPFSKVGGELNNVIFQGFSNKAHDGFLGNSFIGEWCNLGADTNSSNLKNNYSEIKQWSYPDGKFITTGLQFCGLIMGDYSKCGINTMFNSGTVTGVACNIYGSGYPRTFIPSFSAGGMHGYKLNTLESVLEVARVVMGRRGKELTAADQKIIEAVFDQSTIYHKN